VRIEVFAVVNLSMSVLWAEHSALMMEALSASESWYIIASQHGLTVSKTNISIHVTSLMLHMPNIFHRKLHMYTARSSIHINE
jgi:hypothetical protein